MHWQYKNPTITVIIPTYRRKNYLLHVLDCLSKQTIQPIEVFIVDASPIEERIPSDVLESYPHWLKYRLFIGKEGNASAQRNQALLESKGEIIVFIDDDVDFSHDMLENYVKAFKETNANAIAGRISIPGKNLDPKKPITKFTGLVHNPGAPNYISCDFCVNTYVICTANFAVLRESIYQVGGFDEQILGTLDDVDLGYRLFQRNLTVLHYPEPHIIHYMAPHSGSRSDNIKLEWSLSNAFYFQFKNFKQRNKHYLLWNTYWTYCRPSRIWLKPINIFHRVVSIKRAFNLAFRRLLKGPILLDNSNNES